MKKKLLLTYIESGYGHIASMESARAALCAEYADKYDIVKSYIMHENADLPRLARLERFLVKQVQNTNKSALFGDIVFRIISIFGRARLIRLFHKGLLRRSFLEGMEAIRRQAPDVIVTNHYFTQMLAVEYRRQHPEVRIINYNPDSTLHTFWDNRDGLFVVNSPEVKARAVKLGFRKDAVRVIEPCVSPYADKNSKQKAELRAQFGLPADKFTVTVADGGYFMAKGPRFARELIKSGLPITLCVLVGNNSARYDEFTAIAEGRSKLKVKDAMTLKVFRFLENAPELYGASDVFLTKGGSLAMLDSIYMHTPLIITSSPHIIEKAAVREYITRRGCGEVITSPKKAVSRLREFMADPAALDEYRHNINRLIAAGNGIYALADIIAAEADR